MLRVGDLDKPLIHVRSELIERLGSFKVFISLGGESATEEGNPLCPRAVFGNGEKPVIIFGAATFQKL